MTIRKHCTSRVLYHIPQHCWCHGICRLSMVSKEHHILSYFRPMCWHK